MSVQNDKETKEILVAIARLEENTKNVSQQVESVLRLIGETYALTESVKVAHKRIDDLHIDLDSEVGRLEEQIVKLEDNQKWTVRTIGGAIIAVLVDKFII